VKIITWYLATLFLKNNLNKYAVGKMSDEMKLLSLKILKQISVYNKCF